MIDSLISAVQPYVTLLEGQHFLGNSALAYLQAIAIFFLVWLLLQFFEMRLVAKLQRLAKKTSTMLDDALIQAITRIKSPFYIAIAIFCAIHFLQMPDSWRQVTSVVLIVVIVFQAMKAVQHLIDALADAYTASSVEEGNKAHAAAMFRMLRGAILLALWLVVGVALLANFGINVTSIVASLGIGGIAIALALQSVLGDMFSSFSIFMDKPFQVGDFIMVGEHGGTVQHIGLKTTRLKLLRGEELIVPNKTLTASNVQNFKQLQKRRISMQFGVAYETSKKKLESIPTTVEQIVNNLKDVSFSRCHLSAFGESSVDFELVYFIDKADYALFMDRKQEILLALFEAFSKQKIDFAYPTSVVYVKK